MNRRDAIRTLAVGAAGAWWTPLDVMRASERARRARADAQSFQPKFFTAHEWETVRVLVDLIIPADERSGSATDAGVPEFMDFMMLERPDGQGWMRGGLAWLDLESWRRFAKAFPACGEPERRAVLDDIAWPARAKPELSHGVAFFNRFRDLTASGFWSSKMGVEDLQYQGNTAIREWTGCPEAALRKLGVSYAD